MNTEQEKIITKAYCLHSGLTRFSEKAFDDFYLAHKELSDRFPRSFIRDVVRQNIPFVVDEVDPLVDINKLASLLPSSTAISKFFRQATSHPVRVSEFDTLVDETPVLSDKHKKMVRVAFKTVYGAEPETPEAATNEGKEVPYTENVPGTNDPGEAKIVEDVVDTLSKYLASEIFKSHLIPEVKVISLKEVKKGWVADLEFTSMDGKVKTYASAVVVGNKLIPPTELYDGEGHKIGDFTKESFEEIFSTGTPEKAESTETENYQAMLGELAEKATPVQASQIIDTIMRKFGTEAANHAFDLYVKRIAAEKAAKEE